MRSALKWIIITVIFGLLVFLGLGLGFSSIFDVGDGKFYFKKDLINNYNNKRTSLFQLTDFYNKIVPNDKVIEIEFKSDKEIARLAVTNLHSITNDYSSSEKYFCDWDLNINSPKVDSILQALRWTRRSLTEIKSRLDKANCIGVSNGEPTNINFQRSGFGMYSYDIFSKPIPDSLKSKYNDSCTYILYNDKVVLQYSGGVYGPQCFPKL